LVRPLRTRFLMRLSPVAGVAATLALAALPALAAAQTGPRPVTPAAPGDFLFGRPQAEVGVRGGWSFARGGSDWYDFVTDQLTLEPRDFDAVTVASDVGIWLPGRFTAIGGVEFTHTQPGSEYRRLVDNNRQPINQTTRLNVVSLTGGVKYALTERGRSIGRLAWIPTRVAPYVGAGAGATFYDLRQTGDFVDFVDRSVFPAVFRSRGWAPTFYVGGGADVRVLRRMQISADFRYRRAEAELNNTWVDFDPLDLSGARMTVGTSWQF
jgi:opacity protein-like surface antigen